MEYLSKQRYDEINAELKNLIEVVYPKVKDDTVKQDGSRPRQSAGSVSCRRYWSILA